MFAEIENYSKMHDLIPSGSCIIIGLSGGPDSIFLLYFLHSLQARYNLTLIAAHLDHQWRTNSHEDVTFCHNVATKLGIPFNSTTIKKLNVPFTNKGSLEEFGRKARRYYFNKLVSEHNADAVALGHHANDQQETFFIRLVRGTTLSGLIGMKPQDGVYIRPLLNTYKQDILSYLHQHTIEYLIDPSNESESFLRNRIRARVIPELRSCDDRFDNNFLRTLESLNTAEEELHNYTNTLFISLANQEKNSLDYTRLVNYSDYMQKRVIIQWLISNNVTFTLTEKFLNEIMRFIHKGGINKRHEVGQEWGITKTATHISVSHVSGRNN